MHAYEIIIRMRLQFRSGQKTGRVSVN